MARPGRTCYGSSSRISDVFWWWEEETASLTPSLETTAGAGRTWEGTWLSSFGSRPSHKMLIEQMGEGKQCIRVSRVAIKATKWEDVFRTSSLTNSIFLCPSTSCLILRVSRGDGRGEAMEKRCDGNKTTKQRAISGDSHAERECFRGRKPETASREALWAFLLQSHYDFNSLFWLLPGWRFFV